MNEKGLKINAHLSIKSGFRAATITMLSRNNNMLLSQNFWENLAFAAKSDPLVIAENQLHAYTYASLV